MTLDGIALTQVIDSNLACEHDYNANCDTCRLRTLCLPAALSTDEISALENIIEYRREIKAGTHLYRDNQEFTALFAIISGAVKTYKTYADDKISITGCHLPGELFGFSGISQTHYSTNATALENSCICEIPFDHLEKVCRKVSGLQSRLLHLMSHRIVNYHEHLIQFSPRNPVKKRIAIFLLSLSSRASVRGESITQLRLPMPGQDVSNYLGMNVETFSREFSRLAQTKTITKKGRYITILDFDRLRESACHTPHS